MTDAQMTLMEIWEESRALYKEFPLIFDQLSQAPLIWVGTKRDLKISINSEEIFSNNVKSLYDKAVSKIQRYRLLREITLRYGIYNGDIPNENLSLITIEGKSYVFASAIEMKTNIGMIEDVFVQKLEAIVRSSEIVKNQKQIQFNSIRDKRLSEWTGKNENPDHDFIAQVDRSLEQDVIVVVDPLKLKDKVINMRTAINGFLNNCATQIKLYNAKTVVTVPDKGFEGIGICNIF